MNDVMRLIINRERLIVMQEDEKRKKERKIQG